MGGPSGKRPEPTAVGSGARVGIGAGKHLLPSRNSQHAQADATTNALVASCHCEVFVVTDGEAGVKPLGYVLDFGFKVLAFDGQFTKIGIFETADRAAWAIVTLDRELAADASAREGR